MATAPVIANTDRIADYTATASQTAFTIPWVVIADSQDAAEADFIVLKNNVAITAFSFSGNVITGLSGIWTGGTLALDVACAGGERVIIYSKRDPRRTGYFLEGKSLPWSELDKLLDDFAIQLRDMNLASKRAVTLSVTDFINGVNPDGLATTIAANAATASAAAATAVAAASTAVSTAAGYLVVSSIAALKALAFASIPNGQRIAVKGHAASGDGGDREMYWDNAAVDTADAGTNVALTASPGLGRAKVLNYAQGINIAWFGATTASADCSSAIKQTILAASRLGVNKVLIPFRATCSGSIQQNISGVGGEDFGIPDGMEFIGIGAKFQAATFVAAEPGFLYTGAGTFIDIRNPAATTKVGGWAFRNLKFGVSNAAANFIRCNWLTLAGATYVPTNDASTPKYVEHIRFENCIALGGHGPGDFLQACKTFDLFVDEQCLIREWRRGFNLVGCDRPVIRANLDLNGRHVHLEASNTFGNAAKIDARQFGNTDSLSASEARYCIYDQASGTDVQCGLVEDANATATIYMGGSYCAYRNLYFGSTVPAFKLAATALRCRLLSARAPVGGFVQPIIDAAANWNLGNYGTDYRLTIEDADRNLIEHIGLHPRIRYLSPSNSFYVWDNMTTPILTPAGPRGQHLFMDAGNFGGFLDTGDAGINYLGVSGCDLYAGPRTGYGIEFDPPVAAVPYGTMVRLLCGVHFQPSSWFRMGLRGKLASAGTTGTVDVQVRKNGAIVGAAFNLVLTTAFAAYWIEKQLTTFVTGDVLQIMVLNNRDVRFVLDCLDMNFTETQIADLTIPGAFADAAAAYAWCSATLLPYINAKLGAIPTR